MTQDNEAYLQTKLELYKSILHKTAAELFAHRYAMFILAKEYPDLEVDLLLSACMKNKPLQEQTQKQLDYLTGLLDKYNPTPLDELLEALEKWTPPDFPPN